MKSVYGILRNYLGNVVVSWEVYNTKLLSYTKTKTLENQLQIEISVKLKYYWSEKKDYQI